MKTDKVDTSLCKVVRYEMSEENKAQLKSQLKREEDNVYDETDWIIFVEGRARTKSDAILMFEAAAEALRDDGYNISYHGGGNDCCAFSQKISAPKVKPLTDSEIRKLRNTIKG